MYKYAIIGDVHGCLKELQILLDKVSYVSHIISVGDLTDKGPDSNKCCELAAERGVILVDSNHDEKYRKYIKKNRAATSIENAERRKIYESLSKVSKDYLLTARPYFQGEFYRDGELAHFIVVHGGVGPNHRLFPIDGKTYNEILRLRYVDKDTLEKVSTIHNLDGSWGPEHINVWKWQEVYHGQYGPVIHGHIVEEVAKPTVWIDNQICSIGEINLHNDNTILSIDTGCVYGGSLTAALIDEKGNVKFESVKAEKSYAFQGKAKS